MTPMQWSVTFVVQAISATRIKVTQKVKSLRNFKLCGIVKYCMLQTFFIFPGYAEYQAWGQWSACSEQCGGGKRKRERACTSNSIPCSGDSKEEETCNTQACTNSSKYLLRYLAYLMGLFFGIVKLKWTINHSSIVQKISPYLGKRRSIIEISKVINFYRESLLLCLL